MLFYVTRSLNWTFFVRSLLLLTAKYCGQGNLRFMAYSHCTGTGEDRYRELDWKQWILILYRNVLDRERNQDPLFPIVLVQVPVPVPFLCNANNGHRTIEFIFDKFTKIWQDWSVCLLITVCYCKYCCLFCSGSRSPCPFPVKWTLDSHVFFFTPWILPCFSMFFHLIFRVYWVWIYISWTRETRKQILIIHNYSVLPVQNGQIPLAIRTKVSRSFKLNMNNPLYKWTTSTQRTMGSVTTNTRL